MIRPRFPRASGVILHPTSFAGKFGIGDLGEAAYRFVDFLHAAGQTYWQVLPLGPTGFGDSPYQSPSAFAGNPLLISPERLIALGHLAANEVRVPEFPAERVDYGAVIAFKNDLLNRACANFRANAPAEQHRAFAQFCKTHATWLEDVALFLALKRANEWRAWGDWDVAIKTRAPAALARARRELADEIENQKYRQWQFFEQWLALKQYASARHIRIIGDVPIYVAFDSADVWAHAEQFLLDGKLKPKAVAGVPPDYFSATGQLWGNPLYRWETMAAEKFAWWIARFRHAFLLGDVVRIDHFRGFYNYWAVPASAENAIKGKWLFTPGAELFREVTRALGAVAIIAEDLGQYDAKSRAGVDALQAEFGFPGMKVIQFAFGSDASDPFLPHNLPRDCVAYTGTHDNDTAVGWYQVSASEKERDFARRYLGRDGSDIAWDLIRATWASVADTALTTAQDLLALGHAARYNSPSTSGAPNWCWRLAPNVLTDALAARLRDLTVVYGRVTD